MKIKLGILVFVFVLLSGCVNNRITNIGTQLREPPNLNISVNDQTITAVKGTYSWEVRNPDGTVTSVHADSGPPPELVTYQKEEFLVKLNQEINLQFSLAPDTIEVFIWDHQSLQNGVQVNNFTFITSEEGDVIYEIVATWPDGTARYAFLAKILE